MSRKRTSLETAKHPAESPARVTLISAESPSAITKNLALPVNVLCIRGAARALRPFSGACRRLIKSCCYERDAWDRKQERSDCIG